MTAPRRLIEPQTFTLKNMPLRPRARRALLERPGAIEIQDEAGELLLVPERGQQHVYWAYQDIESMRRLFPSMWEQARSQIARDEVDYVVMDLVNLTTREWLDPMLRDADFDFFAEWMEMSHPDLDREPPEIPDGLIMRKASDADVDRVEEIWRDAYGDYGEGEATFDYLIGNASWGGALEADGEVVAFALNGEIDGAEGQILDAAVAPEAWGNGYGRVIVAAAGYQLTTRDAVRATIRVRPDIKQSLRLCSELGFRFARSGLEFRRSIDEDELARRHEARRVAGVKARFGGWR